ncbi:GNAT family N-acetyltransferase [Scytonema sp. NUACC26]|uniref:GNAT family N-acetyltransferase n=1 Tax=Scytonema sp. NUACC26 TaxID=3140176 RepID=UPI0034DBFC7F
MTVQHNIKIYDIDDKSPYLSTVIELWGANRATLGLFPKGAFAERAASREILVAVDDRAGCIGYLLYRCSYDRITIVHLCIASSHRGQNVAKLLIDYLKNLTTDKYSGIGLSCRRDYGIDNMWERFNFIPKYEKTGKGKSKN